MHQQMRLILRIVPFIILFCSLLFHSMSLAREGRRLPATHDSVLSAFKQPPASYRSAPLWVWNDSITRGQIEQQLADFKRHGIGGVFIHPRPGLITPYLSDEWLALCRHAVKVGKQLGMKIWLYDENSYPSGFAGGHVPAQMPDAVKQGLRMSIVRNPPMEFEGEPLLVLRGDSSGFVDVTTRFKGKTLDPGEYRVFSLVAQKPSPWFGGFSYVDVMRRDVTEKFLDVTMNAYKGALGDEFGKVVPGVFQDEAEINPPREPDTSVVNYTPALFNRFLARWGYDLRPHLPSLYENVGEWRKLRHNFYATILDLFIEGWAKPYYDYCTANALVFTGHYWEHEWPRPSVNPDNLACAAYAHMPGIDILMNEFRQHTHAQFGNVRAVKEIRSIANQLGRERTLSETFGAGGWDMTFFDQKRIADWEYALGVNFMNQHLSYVTIKGARKRDHPLSFSYHEPWWDAYTMLADYYGRLSVALSSGEQRNRVLVLEPTTTAWMYYAPAAPEDSLLALGTRFQEFVDQLEAAQVEYDLASEHTLREHGNVRGSSLVVGQRAYDLVILPPGVENLDKPTVTLLEEYFAADGTLLCCGDVPRFIDGRTDTRLAVLAAAQPQRWRTVRQDNAPSMIHALRPPSVEFRTSGDEPASFPLLFHHRRTLDDCELLFLANTDSTRAATGRLRAPGQSCERWDPFTGATSPYPASVQDSSLAMEFSLPPAGSLLLCLRPRPGSAPPQARAERKVIPSQGEMAVARLEPNVLTLDYCDLVADTTRGTDLYFYDAQVKAFQHHHLEKNPWDNGVQYKRTLLERNTFPPASGYQAAFQFTVDPGVDKRSLRAVVERPALCRVSINGHPVTATPGQWWLDKSFGVYEIGRWTSNGRNTIVVNASPFTIHSELEPVYLLGDFALQPDSTGFRVIPARTMRPGPWSEQGAPFYGAGVRYTKQIVIAAQQMKSQRFFLSLGHWKGVVAAVKVNGREAGSIAFEPFTLDVTRYLKPGRNTVVVEVYGSLKNTLGPHHNSPPLGRAWPGQFQRGAATGRPPGAAYSVVGYGLFEDFSIVRGQE